LTWLSNPNSRANNPENYEMKSAPELISIVQKTHPTAKITTVMTFEPYLIHAIVFTDIDKPQAIAYINQYTGDIQGVYQDITFNGFMRSLHGWLLFPWESNYSIGYYIVCAMAFVMLGVILTGMSITGFLIWGSRTVKASKITKEPITAINAKHKDHKKELLIQQEIK
jgi:uncharacterized iron-regulated membrane protein